METRADSERAAPAWLRHGLYPALWAWQVLWLTLGVQDFEDVGRITAIKSGGMIVALLLLEWRYPLQRRWGMSWGTLLKRDLVFILVNGAFLVGLDYALVFASIDVSQRGSGWLEGTALWIQVPAVLLTFEALQYSVHRLMHKGGHPVWDHLWRSHSIHHLPQQLYLVMHAVFHPFNAVLIRILVQLLPAFVLAPDPRAAFVASSIIGFHATISHFNVDLRMGLANYVFVGPELHRIHHSAESHEAKNLGAVTPLFDLLFGTFQYTPGQDPDELGLREADGYPGQKSPLRSLLFPLSLRPVEGDADSP